MKKILLAIAVGSMMLSCRSTIDPNQEMVELLESVNKKSIDPKNSFATEAKMAFFDSLYESSVLGVDKDQAMYSKSIALLEFGDEKRSIENLEILLEKMLDEQQKNEVMKTLAIAYMRLGERINCIYNHSGASCIFPIQDDGVHLNTTGSSKAIAIYEQLLSKNIRDLESRWLLNVAYMTLGKYPEGVPREFLIPGLNTDTSSIVKPFTDRSVNIGLNITNFAGGSIVDDFNNDGYLDIITSEWDLNAHMHYSKNNGDGTFTDMSEVSGLKKFNGGLNIIQTDYNNDGWKDIFVLRGAWKGEFGTEPNSLLKNNGDGTFTDVTKASGLLSFNPTQTATWADFNNDGWLDVFIGNESSSSGGQYPCELFINNQNGTFTNNAVEAGTAIIAFVKGVSAGDYNNDGWMDIFISTLNGQKILLKNNGLKNGKVHFTNVSAEAGFSINRTGTFATWFWDYNNDGWLDILLCNYNFRGSLAQYSAAEALNLPNSDNTGRPLLFQNNQDGTFTNVTEEKGLNKVAFAMGANFGDIDNDGYSDIYMGTGNPDYKSLVPNKMFKNIGGQKFEDVTTSARVGNLQKGHGVSFADLDNDGDIDICMEVGGAFKGDVYQNALYVNPGQNNNNWINIKLEGVTCNRAAIGAKIKVSFTENGVARFVYREVNSGGSFGSNPLQQHIGIGSAAIIENIEIIWPGINKKQSIQNIKPNQYVSMREGENTFTQYELKKYDFSLINSPLIGCAPLQTKK